MIWFSQGVHSQHVLLFRVLGSITCIWILLFLYPPTQISMMNTQLIPLLIEHNTYLLCWLHLPVSCTLWSDHVLAELSNASYPGSHCLTVQASSFPLFQQWLCHFEQNWLTEFQLSGCFQTWHIPHCFEGNHHGNSGGINVSMFATHSVNYLKSSWYSWSCVRTWTLWNLLYTINFCEFYLVTEYIKYIILWSQPL